MEKESKPKQSSMRVSWFEHVRKTRKKLSKGKNVCSHREAMAQASQTWAVEKAKLVKRQQREARKAAKIAAKNSTT